jgi:hypothetical protein
MAEVRVTVWKHGRGYPDMGAGYSREMETSDPIYEGEEAYFDDIAEVFPSDLGDGDILKVEILEYDEYDEGDEEEEYAPA